MVIEITSCQDCHMADFIPAGEKEITLCKHPLRKNISCSDTSIPINCPLKQDNTITFKLKEDESMD